MHFISGFLLFLTFTAFAQNIKISEINGITTVEMTCPDGRVVTESSRSLNIATSKATSSCNLGSNRTSGPQVNPPAQTPVTRNNQENQSQEQPIPGMLCSGETCQCITNGITTSPAVAQRMRSDSSDHCQTSADPFSFLKKYEPGMWRMFGNKTCGEGNGANAYASNRDYRTGITVGGLIGGVEITCDDGTKRQLNMNGPFTSEIIQFLMGEKNLIAERNNLSQNPELEKQFAIGSLHCIPTNLPPHRCSTNCPGGRQQCTTTVVCNDEQLEILCDCNTFDGEDGYRSCLLEFYRRTREDSSPSRGSSGSSPGASEQ